MQKALLLAAVLLLSATSFAKIWRVNNNAGVVADFTQVSDVWNSALVLAGDTIHVESSATAYTGGTPTKRLVYIGVGYFLNPSDASFPYNAGLQVSTVSSTMNSVSFNNSAAAGSKFIGLNFGTQISINGNPVAWDLTFEKCRFQSEIQFQTGSGAFINGITVRKSFFDNTRLVLYSGNLTNFIVENCVFYGTNANINIGTPVIGSNNIIRNNSFVSSGSLNVSIANSYVANNIFSNTGQNTFTNCTIKNNLFAAAQTLPGTATGNQINVNMANVYVGGTTGSLDSRAQLKAGSPAIGAGVTIAGYTPDAGAFGGPDPYKLSGIPGIPSIYSLNVPTSIPTGTATMNITFSSRNNN